MKKANQNITEYASKFLRRFNIKNKIIMNNGIDYSVFDEWKNWYMSPNSDQLINTNEIY